MTHSIPQELVEDWLTPQSVTASPRDHQRPFKPPLTQSGTAQERTHYHASPPERTHATVEGRNHQAGIKQFPFSCIRGHTRLEMANYPKIALAEDESQIYGATSLLHDQSSDTPLANRKNRDTETLFLSAEIVRDQLISNAAISKQEELRLTFIPSLGTRIDFDGVPIDLALHLLELHWNRQHLSYLLTYRPAIMDSLVNNGPYVNKLLLNAIHLQSSL
ncbi:hypothetical protein N7510_005153 [Penicillium lagena]|uniref:uncharacterized protein n=1 Tax=Penicillium lagena TaxID=94218 RepID=UPI0025412F18|nr:uncharacterized protein N7510_005153 [Penicillium lagena]KAJ5621169.1 hypothetical protein N7510_005153 [Penicillium lagena]